MKHIFIPLFLILALAGQSQSFLKVQLHHKLDGSVYSPDLQPTNDLGHSFDFSRLTYYLSEFKVDTGGHWVSIDSSWVLVDASGEASELVFELPWIQSIDSLSFAIGVDSAHNHLDPAQWPTDHPLAPKNPSMHWGWTAGYRFIALEGMAGAEMDHDYQLHGLGDENYFQVTLASAATEQQDTLGVNVYANYVEALYQIDMSEGQVSHGSDGAAQAALFNFRDRVFSSEEPDLPAIGIQDLSNSSLDWQHRPIEQQIILRGSASVQQVQRINLFDLTGKQVANIHGQGGIFAIPDLPDGLYFVLPEGALDSGFKFYHSN